MKSPVIVLLALSTVPAPGVLAANQVKTANGVVEAAADSTPAVRMFKGIPYAQPPVGGLRWKAPQPAKGWSGVRAASGFGPHCMQRSVFSDMVFRSDGMGEDCLCLNVWTRRGRTRSACRCWSTSTAAVSWPATDRSRATTGPAWPRRASWPSPSTTGSGCSDSWHIPS